MSQTKYKRIILKISGEILGSREEGEPIHAKSLENICEEIKAVADMGVEIGLVVGGGNIFGDYREVIKASIALPEIPWVCLLRLSMVSP